MIESIKAAKVWVPLFQNNPNIFIERFKDENSVVSGIFLMSYVQLLRTNEITRIEDLKDFEKKDLWKTAKSWAPLADKDKLKTYCQCIHALNYLKQKPNV